MKRLDFYLTVLLLSILTISQAQQKTALNSNGTTVIYTGATQFTDAYNAAIDGDTIYLPGGNFTSIPTISKRLVIYGAGYYPDSVLATEKTIFSTNLGIEQGADSSVIQGVEINGSIIVSYNNKVDKLIITRCLMDAISITGNGSSYSENIIIKENVILGDITLTNATYSDISSNLIEGRIINGTNNAIQNNILFYDNGSSSYYTLKNTDNCSIAHNVFFITLANSLHVSTDFSTFSNNVFAVTPSSGSNTWLGNYYNVDISTFFVNQSGNTPDFYHDYNLTSPGTYLGVDGTEVGIFGGVYPFKAGTLPNNPHFQSKTISTQTDVNGDLNIQIQVSAQDN